MAKGRPTKAALALGEKNPELALKVDRDLIKAIRKVEKEKDVDLLEFFVARALESDVILKELIRKLIPDKFSSLSGRPPIALQINVENFEKPRVKVKDA